MRSCELGGGECGVGARGWGRGSGRCFMGEWDI